ncbi:Pkinase-domain-containing protein [Auriculariales sp. MPI-PUGE-AT-0066]|nr:Pkinase-domain-containing protein [Auriculariales sp. MPI-PUGE-AT-0066]
MSMPPQSSNSAAATAHLAAGHVSQSQSSRRTDNTSTTQPTSTSARKSTSRIVGEYNLSKTLGAGSMGKVKLAHHIHSGERLAVKIVPRPQTTAAAGTTPEAHAKQVAKDASKEIRSVREASLSMLLHHPYICGMRDFIVQPHNYFMVMDYVNGGQLLDYIISHGRLRERVARKFARQISSALEYCHRNNVVHRDLKIENILISANGNIKLIDFGLSNLYNPASSLSTFCGSLYFAAPELLNAKVYTGPEVDVWSFGVVLYVLVCGKVPFDDQSMPALHAKIKRGVVEYPVWLSADCKALLARILVTNPSLRATMHEVTHHPWMLRGFNGAQSVHFPRRTALRVDDLDPEVIRGMTGFEFGSEKEIMRRLTNLLESEAYQKVLRRSQPGDSSTSMLSPTSDTESPSKKSRRFSGFNFYTKKLFPIGRSNTPASSTPGNGSLSQTGSTSSIFEPSSLANSLDIDATKGFHPLISIYFLVREKMERERLYGHPVFASSKMSLEEAEQEKERQRALEPITIPDLSHQHNGIEAVPSAKLASPAAAMIPSPRPKAPEDALGALPSNPNRNVGTMIGQGVPSNGGLRAPPASSHRRSQSLSQTPRQNVTAPWSRPAGAVGELGEVTLHHQEPPQTAGPAVSTFAEREAIPRPSTVSAMSAEGRGSTLMRRFGSMLDGRAERRRASLLIPRVSGEDRTDELERFREAETDIENIQTSRSMPIPRAGKMPGDKGVSPHKRAATVIEPSTDREHGGKMTRHERRGSLGPGLGLFTANTIGRRRRPEYNREEHEEMGQSTDDEPLDQSDKDFKPLFMKGLFSVQTTSTKSPPVLHQDLRKVLDRMQIQHREIKGGFECLYAPSIDLSTVAPPSPMHPHHPQSIQANGQHSRDSSAGQKLNKKGSKLSFGKLGRGDKTDAESVRSSRPLTRAGTEMEKELPPRPSVSINGSGLLNIGAIASGAPVSPGHGNREEDALSQRSQAAHGFVAGSNGSASGGASAAVSRSASPTTGRFIQPIPRDFASSPAPFDPAHMSAVQTQITGDPSGPLGVRFEVHVVKVPLLPLHGIQFRRVSGDAWQYQMLARRVLTELKL